MLAGGAIAKGVGLATKASPLVAGAIGEGAVMAGSQAEGIRQQTDDGLLTPEQSVASVATGALGSLSGYAGGRLAQKLGINLETADKPHIKAGSCCNPKSGCC